MFSFLLQAHTYDMLTEPEEDQPEATGEYVMVFICHNNGHGQTKEIP